MTATITRHRAASGDRDADRFQAVCAEHPAWITAAHSNRTTEGRRLAERDRDDHNRAHHTPSDRRPAMEITEYAKTLAEAGFEVWHTPGRMGGYLTYRDPSQGTWGTLQYSDYGGWQHLMPLVPSREYGSAMFIGEPLDIWTVEAARQCASPTNHNEIIGTRPNAGTAWLSRTATRIEA